MSVQRINNNLSIGFTQTSKKIVKVKQYDKNTRTVTFNFIDNTGKPIKLFGGADELGVYFRMGTPDGRKIFDDKCVSINGESGVILTFDDNMLATSGRASGEIDIYYSSGEKLSTTVFDIIIEQASVSDDAIEKSDDFSALSEAISIVVGSLSTLDEAKESVQKLSETIGEMEAERISAESERETNEKTRKENEIQRQDAENKRVSDFNSMQNDINTNISDIQKTKETFTASFNDIKAKADDEITLLSNNKIEAIEDVNSYKVAVTDKDGTKHTSPNLLNKIGAGTLDVVGYDEDPSFTITGDFGNQKINVKLPSGKPFTIYNTYSSINDMNADIANIPMYAYVMIDSSVADPDNSKLFMKANESIMKFLTDMSGAQGVQGEKGETGATPSFEIGTVTTLDANQEAKASITGTAENPILNLSIPRGKGSELENVSAANIPYANDTDTTMIKDIVDKKVDVVEGMGLSEISFTQSLKTAYDDANLQKHTHTNKTTLDGITKDKVSNWDDAYSAMSRVPSSELLDSIAYFGDPIEKTESVNINADLLNGHNSDYFATSANISDINAAIGTADISAIGDGTIKGAISNVNQSLNSYLGKVDISTERISAATIGNFVDGYGCEVFYPLDRADLRDISISNMSVYGVGDITDYKLNAKYSDGFFVAFNNADYANKLVVIHYNASRISSS